MMLEYHVWKGKKWMVQTWQEIGPFNFGIHVSLYGIKYVDFHLPFTIITIGNVDEAEYPPEWWSASRDCRSGVRFWRR
jgi:hypothetical protein